MKNIEQVKEDIRDAIINVKIDITFSHAFLLEFLDDRKKLEQIKNRTPAQNKSLYEIKSIILQHSKKQNKNIKTYESLKELLKHND